MKHASGAGKLTGTLTVMASLAGSDMVTTGNVYGLLTLC